MRKGARVRGKWRPRRVSVTLLIGRVDREERPARAGPFPCLNEGIETQGVWLESLGVWGGEDRPGGVSLHPLAPD